MKRLRVPGIIDVVFIDDSAQMRWLHTHPRVTLSQAPGVGVVRQLLRMAPAQRDSAESASRQAPRGARDACEPLACDDDVRSDLRTLINFVTGLDAGADLARATQHWLSSTLDQDHQDPPGRSIDPNVLRQSLTAMRDWAALPNSAAWSAKTAVARSMQVPAVSFRRCTDTIQAPFLAEPLTSRTTIIFLVKRMLRRSADLQTAFLASGWDGGPAARAVPLLLTRIWDAACERSEIETTQCARRQSRHSLGLGYRRRHGTKRRSIPQLMLDAKGAARRSS